MPKCTIDGQEVEFENGENLVDIAKKIGIEIPIFCYHPELTVVAQCRMCAVEIEGMPKLQTACSTSPRDGSVVMTKSPAVKKHTQAVMEFLLINHPLDCPICDKSGECDLQDYSFEHGSSYMRTTEERRTYVDLDMGPVIEKNMNRCIHCTRCIRFGDEVANIREMVAVKRGNDTEITTLDGRALETDYAGNYADICPTGSLTLKDFRFHKRAWMLKKTPTVCEGCSRGCNMEIHQDANVMYRCLPRENKEINRHWLCDEGRFNFNHLQDPSRIKEPSKLGANGRESLTWTEAIQSARSLLQGKKTTVLIGSDLTNEEIELIQKAAPEVLDSAGVFHFGTEGVSTSSEDGHEDEILRMKSKTANLNGAEKLGVQPFKGVPSGSDAVLVLRGGRAQVPDLGGVLTVGVGVFLESDASKMDLVLPGAGFAEKDGTILNFKNVEQKFERAIVPPRGSKYMSEIFMLWSKSKATPGAA